MFKIKQKIYITLFIWESFERKFKNSSCSVSQTSFIHEDFHILHDRLCLRRQKRDGAFRSWDASLDDGHSPSPGSSWSSWHTHPSSSSLPDELYFGRHPNLRKEEKNKKHGIRLRFLILGYDLFSQKRFFFFIYQNVLAPKTVFLDLAAPRSGLWVSWRKTAEKYKRSGYHKMCDADIIRSSPNDCNVINWQKSLNS